MCKIEIFINLVPQSVQCEWFRGFQTYLWSIFLSTFHWNLWLEQSSQIWKDLFLLNLRNSTIPKVFLSEIVNFPSFHIPTFHISCSPPHFPPSALSHTLFTLNHAAKMVVQVKHFKCKNIFLFWQTILFCEEYFTNCLFSSLLGSKKGHFHLVCKMKIFCEGEREEFMNRDQLNLNCPL